jgi:hypothetical protein
MKIHYCVLFFLICANVFSQEPNDPPKKSPWIDMGISMGYAHNFLTESMIARDVGKIHHFGGPSLPGVDTVESRWKIPANGFFLKENVFASKYNIGIFFTMAYMVSTHFEQEVFYSDSKTTTVENYGARVSQYDLSVGPLFRTRVFDILYLYGGIGFHLLSTHSIGDVKVWSPGTDDPPWSPGDPYVWHPGKDNHNALDFSSYSIGLTVPVGIRINIPKTVLYIDLGSNFSFDFFKHATFNGKDLRDDGGLAVYPLGGTKKDWTQEKTYKGKDYSMLSIMPYITLGVDFAFTRPSK